MGDSAKVKNPLHHQLETVLRFAHADYNKNKITFCAERQNVVDVENIATGKVTPRKRKFRRVTRQVQLPEAIKCRRCGNKDLRRSRNKTEKIKVDLIFSQNGLRKSVTKSWAYDVRCPNCKIYTKAPELGLDGRPKFYGYGIKLWIVYQRVALRLSYKSITMAIKDMFNETFSPALIVHYLQEVAQNYFQTEERIIRRLLDSPFLHADETAVNIDNANQYIWVFTNGRYVVFKHTKTRESSFVRELLAEYKGVLISDFYSGYDAMSCKHQKCLVHLIRDLNNDLYSNPFDVEFEKFISEVRDFIVPIMEAVQKYGLKNRHLNKFRKRVERFYLSSIIERSYKSERCLKYQERFKRYKESLFTFLQHDGIPWHNNPAESALRHIILQENISGIFHEVAIKEYLTLLGLKQSCKCQKRSFLRFLLSGEKLMG